MLGDPHNITRDSLTTPSGLCYTLGVITDIFLPALDGELAVPCTRNPL